MGLLFSTRLYLWKPKDKGKLCSCLDQMKLPGCCYCFDTHWLHGYDQDQRIKIPYGRKDLPFEIACVARRSPEVGDIFVWDDRIRVIRQVADHTNQLGTSLLSTQAYYPYRILHTNGW